MILKMTEIEESKENIKEEVSDDEIVKPKKIKKPRSDKQKEQFQAVKEKRTVNIAERNRLKKLDEARLLLENDAKEKGKEKKKSCG
jgi:hypothetical protein